MTAVAATALLLAATASAALVPGTFDPGNTGCVTSVFSGGVLHLAKNCATAVNASAGADITGVSGQTFTSASFTLANVSQCHGGSPRFNVTTMTGTTSTTFFLGCNNVAPVTNGDGTRTYTFTAATIAAGGNQVPVPSGTITSAEVLIDVQGTADLSNITFNGQAEVPNAQHHGHGHGHGHGHKHGHGHGHDEHGHDQHGQDQQGQDQRGHDDDD